jgi:hypothetical protein
MPSIKLPKEYLQKAVELLLKKGFQKRDVQTPTPALPMAELTLPFILRAVCYFRGIIPKA